MSWRDWPGKSDASGATHLAAWHMLDVAAVAELLVERSALGRHSVETRRALLLPILLHDIGKMSTPFRRQIEEGYRPPDHLRHWRISAGMLEGLDLRLRDILGGTRGVRRLLGHTVAGHHGRPPPGASGKRERRDLAGTCQGPAFEDVAAFIEEVVGILPTGRLDDVDEADARRMSWTLGGVTSICDWIGSNTDWFPFEPADTELAAYWATARKRAQDAVRAAGLEGAVPVVAAVPDLTAGYPLRPMQAEAAAVTLPEGPTLALIEDATGAGKTEAALILAHRFMQAGKARGVHFALPTMATADAMFARLRDQVERLFRTPPSLTLAHGRRHLSRDFAALRGGDGTRPEDAGVAAWLADDRRKAFLAELGVGTLDQALLGVLPTRYNTMRLAGLADRVLIVDEAHSYEPYTEEMLQTLLTHQAMIGGSAVVMTATLPLRLRETLLSAWARGRSAAGTIDPPRGYPSLTLADANGEVAGTAVDPVPDTVRRVAVTRIGSFEEACAHLLTAAGQGAACVWVRNAVDEAIAAAEALRAQGAEVDLLHARFALCDRQAHEEETLSRFGKDRASRSGRILVATQVVEASLDLDFDVMVSDLAPIGALVQRAGRLWRHMDRRPRDERPVEGPRLDVLSPDPEGAPGERWLNATLGKGAFVYPLDVQWRTACAVFRTGEIAAPDGLRDLIEAVHGAEAMPVPEALARVEAEREGAEWAERGQARQNVIALEDGYPAMPAPDPNEALATRLGRPQVALVLARRTETEFAFWSADPDPRRAEALSEVQLARSHWQRLGEPRNQDAEAALTPNWRDWEQAQKAVVIVEEGGVIVPGLLYGSDLGLVIDHD